MSVDLESLSEATSGAIGALLSTTILYPIDTCKTKYQAEVRAHGQHQKYRLYILVIEIYILSYILRWPLDTASSRMQTSAFGKSKGLWQTLTKGSWSEAFDGLSISLLLTSNPAIQYTVFDQLKQRLLKAKQDKIDKGSSPEALSAFLAFVLGAISKSIATFLTYPAIRCKVMIQAADLNDNDSKKAKRRRCKTFSGTLSAIWRKEGALGFFKGLQAQILKTVLSSALLLMIKEKITTTTWVLILAMRRFLLPTQGRLKSA